MTTASFRAAVFYYQDFARGERLNVGVVLTSPQTKFCKARVLDLAQLHPVMEMFGEQRDHTEWIAQLLQSYAVIAAEAKERGRDFDLRFDHPFIFTALFGRNSEPNCLGWRDGPSGIVTGSPQETHDYYFERLVQRPTRKATP